MPSVPPSSITALGAALRGGETSSQVATRTAMARIDALDPTLNAFTLVDRDGALAAARVADSELRSGRDRGPLHGVPVSVKDLIDVAGLPTTCGSASRFGTEIAERDAAVVTRLRAAGAVIVGKNTLHEFAYGATGDRSLHGASRNPHDARRMSGGSSGGSAVAVAAGMVPLSIGTDTVGSVRVPASLCGVVGFKPAFDALPTDGVYPCAPSLDHVGLLAATVQDVMLAYEVLTGVTATAEPADPSVGWIEPDDIGRTDPRVTQIGRARLTAAGVETSTVAVRPPGEGDLFGIASTLQRVEAYRVHEDHVEADRDLIDPEVLSRVRSGRDVTGEQYDAAQRDRRSFGAAVDGLFERYDVLALPTTPITAPFVDQREVHVGDTTLEVRSALLSLTSPWNLAGVPAISVPTGRLDGLPVGLQLVTAPGHERLLFSLARQLENPE